MSIAEILTLLIVVWIMVAVSIVIGIRIAARYILPAKIAKETPQETEKAVTPEEMQLSKQFANLLCYDGTGEGQLNLDD